MAKLKRYTAGSGPMILAAIVATAAFIVVACSNSSPVSPSAGSGLGGSTALTGFDQDHGTCSPGSATTKDETGPPFTLANVNTIFIKAGNSCYGPITASGDYGPGSSICWRVTFSGGGVTVAAIPGATGCQGAGLSHIEGLVTETPPPPPTPTPTPEEPPPPPLPTPTPTPTPEI
jgi:hypothetical protein